MTRHPGNIARSRRGRARRESRFRRLRWEILESRRLLSGESVTSNLAHWLIADQAEAGQNGRTEYLDVGQV